MNILITGIAGFIGTHLNKQLSKFNLVFGLDSLSAEKPASVQRCKLNQNIQKASIHDSFLDNLQTKPDIVIHLAAETGISKSLTNPEIYFHQNVVGTFNVLEQCRKNGVKYLIYASSSSVYESNQAEMSENSPHDHQLSFYGTSKRMTELMIENYCQQFGITAIGLRFFTVYGSWTRPDMAAYKFMQAIDSGKSITLYDEGNVYRDFTHVSDIVRSIELLTEKIRDEKPGFHQIFNLGFGSPYSVKEYATYIANHLNKPLIVTSEKLPSNELKATHSNTNKLEQYIGYKPSCTMEQGIIEMTNWFKENRY